MGVTGLSMSGLTMCMSQQVKNHLTFIERGQRFIHQLWKRHVTDHTQPRAHLSITKTLTAI